MLLLWVLRYQPRSHQQIARNWQHTPIGELISPSLSRLTQSLKTRSATDCKYTSLSTFSMGLKPLPLLLLLLAWAASASAKSQVAPGSREPSPEAALLDWARSRGAEINLLIGTAHEGGARGTLAERDFLPGEVIAKVPFNSTVALGGDPFAWAAVHAYEIARRMHTDSSFNATFGAWWASQLLAPETFTEELLEELQDPDLQERVKEAQHIGSYYWEGGFEGTQPLNEVIAPAHMTLDTFLYIMGLVNHLEALCLRGLPLGRHV